MPRRDTDRFHPKNGPHARRAKNGTRRHAAGNTNPAGNNLRAAEQCPRFESVHGRRGDPDEDGRRTATALGTDTAETDPDEPRSQTGNAERLPGFDARNTERGRTDTARRDADRFLAEDTRGPDSHTARRKPGRTEHLFGRNTHVADTLGQLEVADPAVRQCRLRGHSVKAPDPGRAERLSGRHGDGRCRHPQGRRASSPFRPDAADGHTRIELRRTNHGRGRKTFHINVSQDAHPRGGDLFHRISSRSTHADT